MWWWRWQWRRVTCFAVRSASRRAVSSASLASARPASHEPSPSQRPRRTATRDRSLGGAPNRHCGAPFAAPAPTRPPPPPPPSPQSASAAAAAARDPPLGSVRSGEDPDRPELLAVERWRARRLCASSACSSWTRPVSARTRPSRRSVFRRSARSFSVGGASSAAPGVSRSSSAAAEAREGEADGSIWRPPMSTVFCSSVI